MIPERGSDIIEIPVTFDIVGDRISITNGKLVLSALIFIASIILSIILVFSLSGSKRFMFPLILLVGSYLFLKFGLIKEHIFRKQREKLIANDYKFTPSLYWGIYSINDYFPYICKMSNGCYAIFVAMDKDVIVGKDADYDYDHHQAIANAYQKMSKYSKMYCMHIDYMDIIGKDSRMDSLFEGLIGTKNSDLKNMVTRIYDHVQVYMNNAYANYDVYVFYYKGREESFWDDLSGVLEQFSEANYIRDRVLDREEIGSLCKTLMNLNDFSVTHASEQMFMQNAVRANQFFKVIWVEKNGKRTVVNRTKEERDAERRVASAETGVRRKKDVVKAEKARKRGKKKDKDIEDDDIIDI